MWHNVIMSELAAIVYSCFTHLAAKLINAFKPWDRIASHGDNVTEWQGFYAERYFIWEVNNIFGRRGEGKIM